MILSLDHLASRYGLLPTEVLSRASTFDLFVIDVSAKYNQWQMEEERRRSEGVIGQPKRLPTQEEMLAMVKRVKEQQ